MEGSELGKMLTEGASELTMTMTVVFVMSSFTSFDEKDMPRAIAIDTIITNIAPSRSFARRCLNHGTGGSGASKGVAKINSSFPSPTK